MIFFNVILIIYCFKKILQIVGIAALRPYSDVVVWRRTSDQPPCFQGHVSDYLSTMFSKSRIRLRVFDFLRVTLCACVVCLSEMLSRSRICLRVYAISRSRSMRVWSRVWLREYNLRLIGLFYFAWDKAGFHPTFYLSG